MLQVNQECAAPYVAATNTKDDKIIAKAKAILAARMRNENELLTNADLAQDFCYMHLRDKPIEVFGVVYLDNSHRLIKFVELAQGTIDAASVYPREVVRNGLLLNASAVILTHNHPSGMTKPSEADKRITRAIQGACDTVNLRVIDHIIVGSECLSFAKEGIL